MKEILRGYTGQTSEKLWKAAARLQVHLWKPLDKYDDIIFDAI